MSNREIAAALSLSLNDLSIERRALRFEVARSLNYRHAGPRAIDAETHRWLVSRAQRAIKNREIQIRLNAEFAAADELFAAADRAAGWA